MALPKEFGPEIVNVSHDPVGKLIDRPTRRKQTYMHLAAFSVGIHDYAWRIDQWRYLPDEPDCTYRTLNNYQLNQ